MYASSSFADLCTYCTYWWLSFSFPWSISWPSSLYQHPKTINTHKRPKSRTERLVQESSSLGPLAPRRMETQERESKGYKYNTESPHVRIIVGSCNQSDRCKRHFPCIYHHRLTDELWGSCLGSDLRSSYFKSSSETDIIDLPSTGPVPAETWDITCQTSSPLVYPRNADRRSREKILQLLTTT